MAQSHQTIEISNSIIILLPITVDTACLEEKTEEDKVVLFDMTLEQSHEVCRFRESSLCGSQPRWGPVFLRENSRWGRGQGSLVARGTKKPW